jgi:hypothetical protein
MADEPVIKTLPEIAALRQTLDAIFQMIKGA